jgi:hypothetical protein
MLAGALLVACAAGPARTRGTPAGTTGSEASSGIQGRALVDAGCLPRRDPVPCPDRPLAARIVVRATDHGVVVAQGSSGSDGRFRFDLKPGTYSVEGGALNGAPVPLAAPVTVTVSPGHYTNLKLHFDSGRR